MRTLQVAQIRPATRAEGPGKRLALWTQGCSLRCHGCFNPHLWDPDPSKNRKVNDVLMEIERRLAEDPEIEGISFLGGEPFNQAGALAELAAYFQSKSKSIVTFSGFTYNSLVIQGESDSGVSALLAHTDLLIDGPFLQEKVDEDRPWLGSTNQQYIFLTNRYSMKDIEINQDKVEITIEPNGEIHVNGWAPLGSIERLTKSILMEEV
jgi:anaerobic ribonucleoside-triphosphate reductase activating protein